MATGLARLLQPFGASGIDNCPLVYCHSNSLNKSSGAPTGSQPRQGRKMVAQGASPGGRSPHPAFGTPLPRGRERGRGEGGYAYPRLTPWATLFRPLRGLTSSTNF